jgi:hypothetical protein
MPGPEPISISVARTNMTSNDRWDHILARLGWKRMHHLVAPGLYAVGHPNLASPVFVSANYTLSFDALRTALKGTDGYILVLDTKGVNVWCAAGEGTFGTDELIKRIEATHLADVVSHRVLILPQLGAPGVSAHEVKKRSGFKVEYGPVRAKDLPEYMKTHQATEAIRQVTFTLAERLVLIPIEIVHAFLPTLAAAAALYFLSGWLAAGSMVAAVFSGLALFPILLPWLPTVEFSSKGFILGFIAVLPFVIVMFLQEQGTWWQRILFVLPFLLIMPSLTAFLALNFTGSTPFTSRSGVRHEIFTYIPWMAWLSGTGVAAVILSVIIRLLEA